MQYAITSYDFLGFPQRDITMALKVLKVKI